MTKYGIADAAALLHDEHCGDGETTATCGRWKVHPSPQGVTHHSYYVSQARDVLVAAGLERLARKWEREAASWPGGTGAAARIEHAAQLRALLDGDGNG